jgi:hypothetical protein
MIPDVINKNDDGKLPIQTRTTVQNKALFKIAILIAMNASAQEITQLIINSGASCCVTPYLEDFVQQPTPLKTPH